MSHSGNGWKGADAINHRNETFSHFTCNCIHYILHIICNIVHNRRKRMKLSSITFTVLLLVRTKAAVATKVISDWPQWWPCCGTQCTNAHTAVLVAAHSHDSTFLTPGSGPARKTVAEEVALFVLAAHRTSRVTGRWGALVWNIFKQEERKWFKKRSEDNNYNISHSTDLAKFKKNNKIICPRSLIFGSFLRIISFHSTRVCASKRALTHFCSSPFSFLCLVVKFKVCMPRLVACCWAICKRKRQRLKKMRGPGKISSHKKGLYSNEANSYHTYKHVKLRDFTDNLNLTRLLVKASHTLAYEWYWNPKKTTQETFLI